MNTFRPIPTLALLGAVAGVCGWILAEGVRYDWLEPRGLLLLNGVAFAFFVALLAMVGRSGVLRSAPPAAGIAAVLGGSLAWAAGRHETVADYIRMDYPLLCYGIGLLIATPFAAAALARPGGWRDYPTLYSLSWEITVRYALGALFTLLFWGMLVLSDALLRIVGLELIDLITRQEIVAWLLTGCVLGLALGVLQDFSDRISPRLLLRLLRLFVWPVLAVEVVFLLMLPVRGWDGLLGSLSPAATLLAFAIAGVVLVTVAVDQSDKDAVERRESVAALAVLVPLLSGLAMWAIWIRVAAYGWTPERVLAMCIALLALVHGAVYALSVVRGAGWMERLRTANVGLAWLTLLVAMSWFTPLIAPERLSAQSQFRRALTAEPDAIAFRELARDWGRAGDAALSDLRMARPDLAERIDAARTIPEPRVPEGPEETLRLITDTLAIYPDGTVLPADALSALEAWRLVDLARGCRRDLPNGPGCALVFGDFDPREPAPHGMLIYLRDDEVLETQMLRLEGNALVPVSGGRSYLPVDALAAMRALHAGNWQIEPPTRRALHLPSIEIFPDN